MDFLRLSLAGMAGFVTSKGGAGNPTYLDKDRHGFPPFCCLFMHNDMSSGLNDQARQVQNDLNVLSGF